MFWYFNCKTISKLYSTADGAKQYLETRVQVLEKKWDEFYKNHKDLIKSKECVKSDYFTENIFGQIEDIYLDFKTELMESLEMKIQTFNKEESCTSEKYTESKIKLPKITIPTFSGQYAEWLSFRDLFVSLIHQNDAIDSVQKLHYLKGHLSGEAEELVQHIPITNNTYLQCWTLLENRYSNKQYLANCILKRFFLQKNINAESANSFKQILDNTNIMLNSLGNLGIDTSTWDVIVIYIVCQKLDSESRKQWEAKVSENSNVFPTLNIFKDFLEHKFRSLEFLDNDKMSKQQYVTRSCKTLHVLTSSCAYCSGSHKIYNCKEFAQQDVEARRDYARSNALCFNCLGVNHSAFQCRIKVRCRTCKKRHHSLLHLTNTSDSSDLKQRSDDLVNDTDINAATTSTLVKNDNVVSCFSDVVCRTLLATALIKAESITGSIIVLRALLDQGSQASFITESAVQLLRLRKIPIKADISRLGDESCNLPCKYMVSIKIHSRLESQYVTEFKAYVLQKLTSFLPEKKIIHMQSVLPAIELADPSFGTPNKIDLVLGAGVYSQILLNGLIKGPPGFPIAQKTKLGWILSGDIFDPHSSSNDISNNNLVSMHVELNINECLKKFWELEEQAPLNKKMLTDDEKKCEEIFVNTVMRDDCGRYVVKLPFRDENPSCKKGNLKEIAFRRYCHLEKRLSKDLELKEEYSKVINEYLLLNHMELVPDEQRDKLDVVYLPHHAVVRKDKVTSRVRVVFDASCSGTNGVSLNNDLLVGPTLQNTLRHIIMRWRIHPICLVGDIVKMYRQIKVTPKDADEFQRILWRDESGTIQHYRSLRVTFGTASAPYLAVRVLNQVAHDEGGNNTAAVKRILNDFYMDDLMTGCQTVEECLKLKNDISEILQKGGFELQKWASNSKEILQKIGKGQSEKDATIEIGKEKEIEPIQKVLGLTWNSCNDEFEYRVQLKQIEYPVTKRKVISDISRLFDPLGWIAPTIIISKIFIQKLWMSGIDWDQELPPHLLQEWLTYRSGLTSLQNVRIPRWVHTNADDKDVELHGFCDASNNAYAAVIYIRVVDKNNKVHVNIVTSKTKVSPIKQVSIPRLELCGAHLLAKLIREVSETLEIPMEKIHAWTDSSVVLAWLSCHPSKWKTFVANRVSDILLILDRHQWAHVRSKENPADCASRGLRIYDDFTLWKHGPSWLQEEIINYSPLGECQETKLEVKPTKVFHIVENIDQIEELFLRFSTLRRLLRAVTILRRFITWLNCRNTSFSTYLTSEELQQSLDKIIISVQNKYFASDISSIKETAVVKKKSKIVTLNPFIDCYGILRVGGRLQNARITEQRKHPILIPRGSHLAKLIVAEAHEKTLHGGPQVMLNYIRSRYWIIDVRNLAKVYIRRCVTCIRYASKSNQPIMGQLPLSRVTASRPFRHSGVDYAGPISIRTTKGRGHRSIKGYICLFICMATRAVHLEAVSDMSTEGFLAAFKRFVARRGHCSDLWSDNGSNFVGAEKELKILFAKEKSSVAADIANWLASNGTTWHRIPPYSPNFGGLWEAGIKSTKHHLKRVIGNSTLTYEELSTVLSQIEGCLNSRPLSKLSDDTQDPFPLTPGHFLVGEPLVLVPDASYENSSITSLRRWQLTQRMVQGFWRRWSKEYLTQFLHRYRWNRYSPEPKIGDVVLVKEDNLPPARWLYGVIVEKHSGSDQVTRVVSLKCKGTIIKRPTSKICILPVTV